MKSETLFDAIFAAQRDAQTAALYERREITYAELRAETIRAAEIFNALNPQPGERIAILLNDSPEFIASFIAIQSLGAIAVPINMALSTAEQRLILNDCGVRSAIVEADTCRTLLTNASDSLRQLDRVLIVSREPDFEVPRIEGASCELFAEAPRKALGPDFPAQSSTDASFILYTSGSTGEPKGAVHCQRDVFYTNETYCREVLRLRDGDRLFSSSRLPFAYGLGNGFSFPLLNGLTTVLCREKPTPEVISRVFSQYRPTLFFAVPVVFNLLLERHRVNPLDCSSLRLCISAGEALPAAIGEEWQRTFGVPVLDGIGSTEMLHMWMSNHEGEVRYGSSGKLLSGYEARLQDKSGGPIPEGEVGNLWVKGASAASGYWQRPEATARTFVEDWVRTGDLYARNEDGYWFHMGRSDDCFKSSGQWVSPVEVEGVLLRCPGVGRIAVVEDFDEDELPCACAFVVPAEPKPKHDNLEESLRELAKTALPRFKRPRNYLFVTELPYTATGKLQRFKLREQLRARGVTI
jgi:benzoate-CoA ligase family protein